jgi:5-methylcytosine-specific restriction endonuclease McrA
MPQGERTTKHFRRALAQALIRMQGAVCPWCTQRFEAGEQEAVDVDHITPLSAGGSWELDNLQALHPPCHVRKSTEENVRKTKLRAAARRAALAAQGA